MRGDFSQIRLSRGKGYTSVLEQQGRVSLDADANEQRFLDEQLRQTETADIIGQAGGPAGDAGFAITVNGDGVLTIGAGRYYVDGLLVENPVPVPYDSQLSVTSASNSAALFSDLSNGQAVQFYLRAWQRLVTALDDPCLREPALGQADTTARTQVAWQVVTRSSADHPTQPPGTCCAAMYTDPPATPPSTGTLSAGVGGTSGDCGCGPVATAGYQGIENQLYRIEIHTGGDLTSATFKWSRENGSVVSAVLSATAGSPTVTLSSMGPDANLGFQAQQWVELTDDTYEFADPPGAPGTLYQVQFPPDKDADTLTFYAPVTTPVNTALHAKARRWDQAGSAAGPAGIPLSSGTVVPLPDSMGGATGMQFDLECGITVTFGPGSYQPGDYWTFAARTATGTVEWPPCGSDGNSFQPPWSTQLHEAPLACMHGGGTQSEAAVHPEAVANPEAAARARASEMPLPGRETLGNLSGFQLLPPGLFGPVSAGPTKTPPLLQPTIEDCRRIFQPLAPTAIHVTSINWRNDDIMTLDQLVAGGLTVTLDQPLTSPVSGANFIVTIEPVAVTALLRSALGTNGGEMFIILAEPDDAAGVKGLQELPVNLRTVEVLDMGVTSENGTLTWSLPGAIAMRSVQPLLAAAASVRRYARVRVRLAGQALFHARLVNWDGKGPRPPVPSIYLDGAVFGEPGTARIDGAVRIDLRLPSGSGQVASDLESWFYLAPTQTVTSVSVDPDSLTAVFGAGGAFEGVAATGTSNLVTPMATVALLYPALADVRVRLTLNADTAGANAIATVPGSVTVPRGAMRADVPVTISASPPANETYTFTLTAMLSTAVSTWNPSDVVNFTVAGPTGRIIRPPVNPAPPVNPVPGPALAEQPAQPVAPAQPAQPAEPAKPAEQTAPAPEAVAPVPPAPPTIPLPLPELHPPGNPAQPVPPGQAEPPTADEPPAAPDSPSPPDPPPATS
jgi:hypothetical protein